jgi:hypothetical protein
MKTFFLLGSFLAKKIADELIANSYEVPSNLWRINELIELVAFLVKLVVEIAYKYEITLKKICQFN